MRSQAFAEGERLALEALSCGRFFARHGHGIPEHEFLLERMDPIDKAFHLWNALGLPVPGEGIAPAAIERLPAVIDDHALEAEFAAQAALVDDGGRINALVIAIPRRIERHTRRLRHRSRRVAILSRPPFRCVTQHLVIRLCSRINSESHLIFLDRRLLAAKQLRLGIHVHILFLDPAVKLHLAQSI